MHCRYCSTIGTYTDTYLTVVAAGLRQSTFHFEATREIWKMDWIAQVGAVTMLPYIVVQSVIGTLVYNSVLSEGGVGKTVCRPVARQVTMEG